MLVGLAPLGHRASGWMLPISIVQLRVCRCLHIDAQTEQRSEAVERVEAPVEPEHELVEVRLQVLRAHAVMYAVEPRLQIAEDQVDDRQVVLGDVGLAPFGAREMLVARASKTGVALPGVGDDHLGRRVDGRLHEALQTLGGAIRNDRQAQPARITTAASGLALAVLALGLRNALFHFDSADHGDLVVDALPLAARPPANPRLVDFHVSLDADPTGRDSHRRAELVQDLEGRLVAVDPELALQLHGGHARSETRDQERGPEPRAQGHVRAFHDGSGEQRDVAFAGLAAEELRATETHWLSRGSTTRAHEPLAPADRFQIDGARLVIREHLLKCREGLGKLIGHAHLVADFSRPPLGVDCFKRLEPCAPGTFDRVARKAHGDVTTRLNSLDPHNGDAIGPSLCAHALDASHRLRLAFGQMCLDDLVAMETHLLGLDFVFAGRLVLSTLTFREALLAEVLRAVNAVVVGVDLSGPRAGLDACRQRLATLAWSVEHLRLLVELGEAVQAVVGELNDRAIDHDVPRRPVSTEPSSNLANRGVLRQRIVPFMHLAGDEFLTARQVAARNQELARRGPVDDCVTVLTIPDLDGKRHRRHTSHGCRWSQPDKHESSNAFCRSRVFQRRLSIADGESHEQFCSAYELPSLSPNYVDHPLLADPAKSPAAVALSQCRVLYCAVLGREFFPCVSPS